MQTTDIRKGIKIQIDGVPFHVVEHQFVKPGKGQAFTRARIRNLVNGNVSSAPGRAASRWSWPMSRSAT